MSSVNKPISSIPVPSIPEYTVVGRELNHAAFLCHEGTEKRTVLHLLRKKLHQHGINDEKFFYDQNMERGGNKDENQANRLRNGLLASKYMIVFLTVEFLRKPWPMWELKLFLDMMKKDERRKLLPIFYRLSAGECKDIARQEINGKLKEKLGSAAESEEVKAIMEEVKILYGIDADGEGWSDDEVVKRIMKDVFKIDIRNEGTAAVLRDEAHDVINCRKLLCDYPRCAEAIKSGLNEFFAVPPLPKHARLDFESSERPEKILRDKLLLEGSDAVAAVGVKGMGGVGKTTCLIGVAKDLQVREKFSDGVLWVQLSMGTKVADMREIFINILKHTRYHWEEQNVEVALNPRTSLDGIVKITQEVLKEKRCLIVLDDFWPFDEHKSSISYFKQIMSKSSRILLSTRYGNIVRGFNADQTDVGDLDDETASGLFDDWCGGSPTGEKEENLKKEILELCSNVALGVCIAGSNVKEIAKLDGSKERGLERVLKKFKQNIDGLQGLGHTRDDQMLNAVIQTTLDTMADEGHKNAYQCIAVFSSKTRVPNQALEALWGVDADYVEDRVDLYISCSLATRKVVLKAGGSRSFYVEFHDQHLAYARYSWCCAKGKLKAGRRGRSSEEEKILSGLHAQLVDGYEELHEDVNARVWWEADEVDDGYFHDHYTYHLVKSGKVKLLVELLTDYRWIAMRCGRQEMTGLMEDFSVAVSTLETYERRKHLQRRRLDFDGRSGGSEEPTAADDTGTGHDKALGALLLIQKALLASRVTLWEREDEIAFQLVGRLLMHSDESALIKKVIDGARQWERRVWLCPMRQCFESPMSGAFQVFNARSSVGRMAVAHENPHLVACGTSDGVVRVWDWRTGCIVGSPVAHEKHISAIAISKDGSVVLSASYDKTVRLWNVKSGEHKRVLRGHDDCVVKSLAMMEDGRVVVSGWWDGTVRLWDVESGECKRVLRGHDHYVGSLAVMEDGRVVVSGSNDCTVRLWDVESGECKRVLRGHKSGVGSVAVMENGRVVVSGSEDETVRLWDVESGKCKRVLRGHASYVTSVAVTEEGGVVVSGSFDETVRLWNAESGKCMRVFRGHQDWVNSVDVTEDGSVVVSGSNDKTVRLWNVDSRECERVLREHARGITSVAVAEEGGVVVLGSEDCKVRLCNLENGKCMRVLRGHRGGVYSVAVTEDGSVVVSGSSDETVRLWNTNSGECKRELQGHEGEVSSVAVTKDGSVVVSGSGDHTVRLWNAESGECKRVLQGHRDTVESVAVADDGSIAVSGAFDEPVRLWNVESGDCMGLLEESHSMTTSLAVTGDGIVVASGWDEGAGLWSVESRECLRTIFFCNDNTPRWFMGRDLLRWARSVGLPTTLGEADLRYDCRRIRFPRGHKAKVEFGVVEVMHTEDSGAIMSATLGRNVESALVINWKGRQEVIAVGSHHVFVLEIVNSAQLENK